MKIADFGLARSSRSWRRTRWRHAHDDRLRRDAVGRPSGEDVRRDPVPVRGDHALDVSRRVRRRIAHVFPNAGEQASTTC